MASVGVAASPDVGFEVPLSDLLPTPYNISVNTISRHITDPRFVLLVPIDGFDRLLETGVIRYKEKDRAVGIGFKCKIPNVFNTVLHNVYATTHESGFLNTPAFHARPFNDTDALFQFVEAMRLCTLATMQSFGPVGEAFISGTVQTTSDTVAYIMHIAAEVPRARLRAAAVHAIVTLTEHLADYDLEAVFNVDGQQQHAAVGAPGDYVAPADEREVYEYEHTGDEVSIKLIYDNKKTLFEMTISAPPGEHFDAGQVTQITGAGRPRGASSASSSVADATQDKLNRLLKMVKEWEPEITWKQDVVIGFVRGELGTSSTQEPVYDNKRFYSHCGMFRELCYSMGWRLRDLHGHVDNSYMLHTIISNTERKRDAGVVRAVAPKSHEGLYDIEEEEEEEDDRVVYNTPESVRRINLMSGWFDDELPEDPRRVIYSFLDPMEQATMAKTGKAVHSDLQPNIDRIKKETQDEVQKSMLKHGGGFRNTLELKPPAGTALAQANFETSMEKNGPGALELTFTITLPEGVYWRHRDFSRHFPFLGNSIMAGTQTTPVVDAAVRRGVALFINAVVALMGRYGVQVQGGYVSRSVVSFYAWNNKAPTVQRDLVMQLRSNGWGVAVKHGRATLHTIDTPHWVGAAFEDLPPELKGHILGRLAPRDRAAFQQVSHSSNALIKAGQHLDRQQLHASITADISAKSFVTYELVPEGGTPAIITLSLQRPETVSLTIVTPFNHLIDYHDILDFGLQHRPNNVNLDELDEPLNESLQSTVHTAVSLFMGALALYKTRVHYSGVNTNYVSIWAQNRSRYRDIAARFVVGLAQQGWGISKSGPRPEPPLVVEDFVGGIFDAETSPELDQATQRKIYSYLDPVTLTQFQATGNKFNNAIAPIKHTMKERVMDDIVKWVEGINSQISRFHGVEPLSVITPLPKGVNLLSISQGETMMMVGIECDPIPQIRQGHTHVGDLMGALNDGEEETKAQRRFLLWITEQFYRLSKRYSAPPHFYVIEVTSTRPNGNFFGPQPLHLRYAISVDPTFKTSYVVAEWVYFLLAKRYEVAAEHNERDRRDMYNDEKGLKYSTRPKKATVYLPETLKKEVQQVVEEEARETPAPEAAPRRAAFYHDPAKWAPPQGFTPYEVQAAARRNVLPLDEEEQTSKRQRLEGAMEDALKPVGLHTNVLSFLNDQDIVNYARTTDDDETREAVFKDRARVIKDVEERLDEYMARDATEAMQIKLRDLKYPEGIRALTAELDWHYLNFHVTFRPGSTYPPQYTLDDPQFMNPRTWRQDGQRKIRFLIDNTQDPTFRRLLRYIDLLGRDEETLVEADGRVFKVAIPAHDHDKMINVMANIYVQLREMGLIPTVVVFEDERSVDENGVPHYEVVDKYSLKDVSTVPRFKNRKEKVVQIEEVIPQPQRRRIVPQLVEAPMAPWRQAQQQHGQNFPAGFVPYERQTRQRVEGIFEADDNTPELANDMQRKIMSFLDLPSLTNLQATGSKYNNRINDIKHMAKDRTFPKILKWLKEKVPVNQNPESGSTTECLFVINHETFLRPGAVPLPWGVLGIKMKVKEVSLHFEVNFAMPLSERNHDDIGELIAELDVDDAPARKERLFLQALLRVFLELFSNRSADVIKPNTYTHLGEQGWAISISFYTENFDQSLHAAAEVYYHLLKGGHEMAVEYTVIEWSENWLPGLFGRTHESKHMKHAFREPLYLPEALVREVREEQQHDSTGGEMDAVIGKLKGIKIIDESHKKLVAKMAKMAQR